MTRISGSLEGGGGWVVIPNPRVGGSRSLPRGLTRGLFRTPIVHSLGPPLPLPLPPGLAPKAPPPAPNTTSLRRCSSSTRSGRAGPTGPSTPCSSPSNFIVGVPPVPPPPRVPSTRPLSKGGGGAVSPSMARWCLICMCLQGGPPLSTGGGGLPPRKPPLAYGVVFLCSIFRPLRPLPIPAFRFCVTMVGLSP